MLKNILHIIRWPNLLMLAGIQLLVYFQLVAADGSVLSWPDLTLIILITIVAGAGGYIINDYYDHAIDRINKPDKQIAGNFLSLEKVRNIYLAFVLTGFCLSIWTAFRLDLLAYLFIYPFAVTGLWLYSYTLKCRPIIGNLWVSLFCAGVVGVVALPDILLNEGYVFRVELWYYLAFAFLSTWLREVIKDIEDVEGDAKANCQTAVVYFGRTVGRWMVLVLGLLLIGALYLWDNQLTNHWAKLMLTVLQGFTVGAMAFVWWAKNKSYYHHSTVMKFIMIGGTLILLML